MLYLGKRVFVFVIVNYNNTGLINYFTGKIFRMKVEKYTTFAMLHQISWWQTTLTFPPWGVYLLNTLQSYGLYYIYPFIYPSICASIHSFIQLFIHPFIHPFIHSLFNLSIYSFISECLRPGLYPIHICNKQ